VEEIRFEVADISGKSSPVLLLRLEVRRSYILCWRWWDWARVHPHLHFSSSWWSRAAQREGGHPQRCPWRADPKWFAVKTPSPNPQLNLSKNLLPFPLCSHWMNVYLESLIYW